MFETELAAALTVFDRVEVTLGRLESVWKEIDDRTPIGLSGSWNDPRYAELLRSFNELATGLPTIGGHELVARPLELADVLQQRMDSNEVGLVEAAMQTEELIREPGDAIAEYRHRFAQRRRELVRRRADELVTRIDLLLVSLTRRYERSGESLAYDEEWIALDGAWRELLRLLGNQPLTGTRVGELNRHVRFAQAGDLHDIADWDWPSVRPAIELALYVETEPLPVDVEDLAELVSRRPTGAVSTELNFAALDDEGFERLVFALLTSTEGYENAAWLMETRAPDRGRDLSVEQVSTDPLTGTVRLRVIVQCKNWKKSLGVTECAAAVAPMRLWEPPPVDLLIIATTGRFSEQGVQWVESHNRDAGRPRIAMWPDSHLELLLASRGDLVIRFGLRDD